MSKSVTAALTLVLFFLIILGIAIANRNGLFQSLSGTSVPTQTPHATNTLPPTSSAMPSPSPDSACSSQDLAAQVALSPGAGNIYGTFTLKNVSDTACQIPGNTYISLQYNASKTPNLQVQNQGQNPAGTITLNPSQIIYSQIHYPNGPQCSSTITNTQVTFSYPLLAGGQISFTNQNGSNTTITTCSKATDMTTVQIWNMSLTPITPQ